MQKHKQILRRRVLNRSETSKLSRSFDQLIQRSTGQMGMNFLRLDQDQVDAATEKRNRRLRDAYIQIIAKAADGSPRNLLKRNSTQFPTSLIEWEVLMKMKKESML